LLLSEGKLSLDPQRVWVDAWAVQRLAGQADGSARGGAEPFAPLPERLGTSLLRLYLGHFLGDEEAAWALAFRERLRSRFLRACAALAEQFERAERFDDAIGLYRRVVELDPLAEEFHRGLIRGLQAQGHRADALDAYRRCREILSVTLGVEPSARTQALYRSLKG
jgi:DNA-binding SARP family transcriptional activator